MSKSPNICKTFLENENGIPLRFFSLSVAEIFHGGWKLVEFLDYQNRIQDVPLGVQLFGSFQKIPDAASTKF